MINVCVTDQDIESIIKKKHKNPEPSLICLTFFSAKNKESGSRNQKVLLREFLCRPNTVG